jgi:hypothetical protein
MTDAHKKIGVFEMVIWKYKLEITDLQSVQMPVGAIVLSVHRQGPDLCLWSMVDPSEPMQARHFEVHGTGNQMPDGGKRLYVGTVVVGALVWHVFERLA